jgi:hypothetical protein
MGNLLRWGLGASFCCFFFLGCGGGDSGSLGGAGADGSVSADGAPIGDGGNGADVGPVFGHDAAAAGDGGGCSPGSPDQNGCSCTPGETRACYTGPAPSRNVGACHDGTQTCVKSGEFGNYGPCTGAVTPGPETCSSTTDTNCNGKVGCADPVACPGGCAVDAGIDVGVDAGGCAPPIISPGGGYRCPVGTILGPTDQCCPCTVDDCATNNTCCSADVCGGNPACATCGMSTLPALCNGNVDVDCDDFPEDCDQLCCPCKPSSCMTCPTPNEVPCDDGTGNMVCTDVTSNDNQCGACDTACISPQHCVSGWCQ